MEQPSKKEQAKKLRRAAEQVLATVKKPADTYNSAEVELALQELQVHQIELEMQNDELFRANEQIELQRQKFEHLYELAPVAYFILGSRGMIEEVNTTGMALLEAGKASIRGKNLVNFVVPAQIDEFYRFYHLAANSFEKQRCHLKMLSKTGREFHALLEANKAVEGKCYLAMLDVTEGIEARQRINETTERLQLALESATAGIWELYLPSMRFSLDSRNQRLCNASEAGFQDDYSSFIDLLHPDDRFMVDQHFRTAINSDGAVDTTARLAYSDQQPCYVDIKGRLITNEANETEKRFAGIISDVTQRIRLQELEQQKEQQRQQDIALATLHAEEKERKRISEALHDSLGQLLYGIKLHLAQVQDNDQQPLIRKLTDLLGQAIRQTRNISYELAPPTLAEFGLAHTINQLCERLSTPAISISAAIDGPKKLDDLMLETAIFRITQELINNAIKHAEASRVRVEIDLGCKAKISVKDNGKGFVVNQQLKQPHGAGLSSIRNRLVIYSGNIKIDSAPGKGTHVEIEMELKQKMHG